jgi:DNA-binding CsgD family transcriptional regulator/tetratricopeptide (TPR) repeat protein
MGASCPPAIVRSLIRAVATASFVGARRRMRDPAAGRRRPPRQRRPALSTDARPRYVPKMAVGAAQAAFVGRAGELARLDAALVGRVDRPGVFVGGEAGIGKTRLVREFAARARAAGATVVVGGCLESGSETLPFAPFVEALGRLCEALGARADVVFGPGRAELAVLLPTLGEAPAHDGDRIRLFEAVRDALDRADDPTVVVLEDLHWADRSSLELLSYLVRRLRHGRTFVVGTFRTDEIGAHHPATPVFAELERAGRSDRLELPPFGRAEVDRLIDELRPRASALDADVIAARSEGNPFFVTELARASSGPGGALPATLRDLLLFRVARLSPEARGVVDLLAVIGRPANAALLGAAWDGDPAALGAGIATALDAHVLVATPSGTRTTFRHDLLADAVRSGLGPIEQARLHKRVAVLLTARPDLATATPAGAAAEIARHWVAAENDPESLVASVRAALEAERIPARAEALAHYEAALAAWQRVPGVAAVEGLDHAEVLHRAAYAASTLHVRLDRRAIDLERRAVAEIDAVADPGRAGEAWASLARWYGSGPRDFPPMVRAAEHALDLVPSLPPSRARALALASLAYARMVLKRCGETVGLAREAADIAATVGATPIEAWARAVLGVGLCDLGRDEEALVSADRAVEIAAACRDSWAVIAAHGDRLYVLHASAAASDEIERAFDGFRAAAERVNVLEDAEHQWIVDYVVHLHCATGAWDAVESETTEVMASFGPDMTPAGRELYLWMRGSTRIQRGRLDQGEDDFRTALTLLGDGYPESVAGGRVRLAMAPLLRGRPDEAIGLLEEAAAAIDPTDFVLLRCQVDAMGLRAAADLAEAGRARREASAVARAEAFGAVRLQHVRGALAGTLVPGMGVGRVVRTLGAWGLAEASRLDGRSDPVAWAEAAALLDRWTEPALPPYARYRRAEALLAAGDHTGAAAPLRAAHARAVELGAAPLVADIASLARRGRIDLADVDRSGAPTLTRDEAPGAGAPPADPYGLSPREREVLALLVDGRTNREIGATLFISEKTASVHVTHILDKLGVNSRGAAAAVAVRAGLVQPAG